MALTEDQFQQQVTDLCDYLGLLWYHTHDSRRSNSGFPDLVIVGVGVVYAELKTQKGKVSPTQYDWLTALDEAGQEAYVWRPDDLPVITNCLHRLAGRRIRVQEAH